MRRLGLIVGGVHKAGTSSLFYYLQQHPGLLAPTRKELHVFDDPQLAGDPHEQVARYFGPSETDAIPFDVTPIYLFWPEACARIRAYNPAVRLIFIFRDPIERALSHWRMTTARGNEALSFGDAIRDGRQRLETGDDRAMRVFSYVERGYYGEQVARLLSLFRREQVLFVRSRDLAEARRNVLARISAFMGIAPFPEVGEARILWSASAGQVTEADADYLRALYRDDLARFAELSGVDVSDWPTVNARAPFWRPSPPSG